MLWNPFSWQRANKNVEVKNDAEFKKNCWWHFICKEEKEKRVEKMRRKLDAQTKNLLEELELLTHYFHWLSFKKESLDASNASDNRCQPATANVLKAKRALLLLAAGDETITWPTISAKPEFKWMPKQMIDCILLSHQPSACASVNEVQFCHKVRFLIHFQCCEILFWFFQVELFVCSSMDTSFLFLAWSCQRMAP